MNIFEHQILNYSSAACPTFSQYLLRCIQGFIKYYHYHYRLRMVFKLMIQARSRIGWHPLSLSLIGRKRILFSINLKTSDLGWKPYDLGCSMLQGRVDLIKIVLYMWGVHAIPLSLFSYDVKWCKIIRTDLKYPNLPDKNSIILD